MRILFMMRPYPVNPGPPDGGRVCFVTLQIIGVKPRCHCIRAYIGTCINPPPLLRGGGDQEPNQRDQERQETIEEEAAVKNVDGLTEKNTKMSDSA